jgi:hypothetical protein
MLITSSSAIARPGSLVFICLPTINLCEYLISAP